MARQRLITSLPNKHCANGRVLKQEFEIIRGQALEYTKREIIVRSGANEISLQISFQEANTIIRAMHWAFKTEEE